METLAEAMSRVKSEVSLADYCETHLEARGKDFYVCPSCGSGSHKNGTPAFHIMPGGERWRCFSCNTSGDIFDLAGVIYGADDKADQIEHVASWAGVDGWNRDGRGTSFGWDDTFMADDHEPARKVSQTGSETEPSPSRGTQTGSRVVEGSVSQAGDETRLKENRRRSREYVLACQANINHPDAVEYLTSRGIDLETAKAWGLGYDPNAGGAKRADGTWCRRGRIVIPWKGSTYYHIDRSIDHTAKVHKYDKPNTEEVGPQPLWNPAALKAPVFFVVEGAFDALAVQTCGYEAVAMGTANNSNDLVAAMRATDDVGVALLLNDSDDTGAREQAKMAAAFDAAGLAYSIVDPSLLGTKDAFELWGKDAEALSALLGRVSRQETAEEAMLGRLRVMDPTEIAGNIHGLTDAVEPLPTGMATVDVALEGGLPSRGLVTVGAVSSVGKTTWCVQVCDNMAAAGRVVLFVTIEMSAAEIVAKTLSRLTSSVARSGGGRIMVSAQHVMSATERAKWDREKVDVFNEACNRYDRMTHREDGLPTLNLMEAVTKPRVSDIRAAAEAIAKRSGGIDCVCIDYLQLLEAPEGHERDSDKAIVDGNVMLLRQMARDLHTCVIAVSSLNRASYNGSVDLSSFKESGAVEYGSDLLLALQPRGMEADTEGESEAKAKKVAKTKLRDFKASPRRECELVVLKNRNGGLPRYGVPLVYEAMTNTFMVDEEEARAIADAGRKKAKRL